VSPVEAIEYWVDSGAPEDVKKALVEGPVGGTRRLKPPVSQWI